tara:strand:- start:162 stop:632 length:471 start_codon:yes stop_codon:yes gene_type:complete
MPRQQYTIRSFAGGVNTVRDPRDISENEASRIDNMSIDALGKIKSAGTLAEHRASPSSGGSNLPKYISVVNSSLDNRSDSNPGTSTGRTNKGGGFNLFYFESDHSRKNEFNDNSSQTFTVGTSSGNIWFVNPQNSDVSGTATKSSGLETQGASSSL